MLRTGVNWQTRGGGETRREGDRVTRREDAGTRGHGNAERETWGGAKIVRGDGTRGRWRVPLSYRRDGKRFDVLVRLAGVHSEEELLAKLAGGSKPAPMPVPKPGEKPAPGGQKPEKRPMEKKPDDGDDHPPMPGPLPEDSPLRAMHAEPPMPEIVRRHFEEKRGYANYYFNRQNRDRVWKAMMAQGDLGPQGRSWTIAGPLDNGGRYRLDISDNEVLLKVPTGQSRWTAGDEIGSSLAPAGSGGLFAALCLWRRLLVAGPEKFGDVYYQGTAPLAGAGEWAEVLVGLYGGVECRYYFDARSGLLVAMEMFPEENADPCEVSFLDYGPVGGRNVPLRIEVRYGSERFATFKVDLFSLDKPMQP